MKDSVKWHHQMPAQLRFSDVDAFGHVNNSVYFSLFDMCKTKYITEVMGENILKKVAIVVASIRADFLAPIYFPDEIVIQTAITHVGNRSFLVSQRAINIRTKEVKCECCTIMVTYDPIAKTAIDIPDKFRAKIQKYEGDNLS